MHGTFVVWNKVRVFEFIAGQGWKSSTPSSSVQPLISPIPIIPWSTVCACGAPPVALFSRPVRTYEAAARSICCWVPLFLPATASHYCCCCWCKVRDKRLFQSHLPIYQLHLFFFFWKQPTSQKGTILKAAFWKIKVCLIKLTVWKGYNSVCVCMSVCVCALV